MKITYIYHSGFLVEFENFDILFDYFKDTKESFAENYLLQSQKPLYVLSSHVHRDHFNKDILQFPQKRGNVKFILSLDIKEEAEGVPAFFIEKGQVYKDENMEVRAFGSTDEGVSFYITTKEGTLFFAGDLNNWHWDEEAGEEERQGYEEAFHKELTYITAQVSHADVVFFPTDPRLGKNYLKGPSQFIEAVKTRLFVPMHFWNKYEKAAAFEAFAKEKGVEFFKITKEGDVFQWK